MSILDVQIAGDGFQPFWRNFIYQPVHIRSRCVQKLSDGFPPPVNPAIARWKVMGAVVRHTRHDDPFDARRLRIRRRVLSSAVKDVFRTRLC